MEVKPGYKQTEAGVIPEDWEIKSLTDLCPPQSLVRGPFGGSLKKESFVQSGFKVYEQRNAIYKTCDIGSYFINRSKFSEMQRFSVAPGDFIISCSGTIGRIFQIPPEAPPGIINQALLKIRTYERVVFDQFFYLVFEWDQFQAKIIDSTQGGAMKNLVGMEVFKKTPFIVPPIPEQHAIAGALEDVDALLRGLEKLIDKKRDLKKAAMQQLLVGQKRLPGFAKKWEALNMAEKSTLKARIGWQGLTTAEYLQSGEYYLVTGTDFVNGRINWSSCCFVSSERYAQDRNIQLRPKDILLTKDGTIGKVGFVDYIPGPATLNSGVFVIRPKEDAYDPQFFYCILTSRIFDDFLTKLKAGSTISHLYQKDFVNFSFLAPATLNEQTAIAAVLSDTDAEVSALEQRLAKTRLLKQGMMRELLTGRTRLI